jgi:hypothetical protein
MEIFNRTQTISSINIEIIEKNDESISKESNKNNFLNDFLVSEQILPHNVGLYQIIINYYTDNKTEFINKMLSISVHIFIMVIFEIYFYFNYVIYLEKAEFMNMIHSYLKNFEYYQMNIIQQIVIEKLIMENSDEITQKLYLDYIQSLNKQNLLRKKLLGLSYNIASIVGGIFCFFLICGCINWKDIRWKTIIIDNILMFIFLGTFEYLFFSNIILHYNPVTNEEIKYTIYKGIVGYLNQTNT